MKRKWFWWFLAPPAMVVFLAICGEIVMHLWNWLLPALFGCHAIGFWQALGLLVLCRMLFGGWGHNNGDRSHRVKAGRWECMTPEQREKFRQEMRNRWSRVGAPIGEDTPPA